jgi:hypothetical protein
LILAETAVAVLPSAPWRPHGEQRTTMRDRFGMLRKTFAAARGQREVDRRVDVDQTGVGQQLLIHQVPQPIHIVVTPGQLRHTDRRVRLDDIGCSCSCFEATLAQRKPLATLTTRG